MVKVKIVKPSIPIIFLDTFFFIDFVANRYRDKKSPYFAEELELVDLIHRLTKEKKILCPKGDQENEYELGFKYEDEIRKEQVQLSYGIDAMYHYGVEKYQIQVAMSAYTKGVQIVEHDYKSIFSRDPVKELEESLSRPYIVTAHLPMGKKFLDKQRKTKKELAREFEKLRLEKRKMGIKYNDWVREENLAPLNVIQNTLKSALPKLARNEPITEAETNGFLIMGDFMRYFEHYSGREASIDEVAKFIQSDHYATIPFISIKSKLFSSMITQSGVVKESDSFDFDHVSQMMPFSTYFLTDRSLKHRITTSPLNLDKEYDVRVYSMKEIKDLIKDLKLL